MPCSLTHKRLREGVSSIDTPCTCLHRNMLQDDAFVDEVRISIRYAAAVLVRRVQKVSGQPPLVSGH